MFRYVLQALEKVFTRVRGFVTSVWAQGAHIHCTVRFVWDPDCSHYCLVRAQNLLVSQASEASEVNLLSCHIHTRVLFRCGEPELLPLVL